MLPLSYVSEKFTITRVRSILIIDDDKDDIENFVDAIAAIDEKIACKTCYNCKDGLLLLKKIIPPPSFVFLDLNLPKMNGFECLAEIKKSATLKNIPVIIYTTSKSSNDMEHSRSLGAAGFLTKPPLFNKLKKELLSIIKGNWSGYFSESD